MDAKERADVAVNVKRALKSAVDIALAVGGYEYVDAVLEEVGLARKGASEDVVITPGTHLASAMALVEDYVLPAETGPSGTNDTVEAAVCLRRRIRDAQTCWSTLEALRSKQGR